MDCKRDADVPWFLISRNLLKVNVAQVPLNCLENMESVETLQFQNFLRSTLEAPHSGQTGIRLWAPFRANTSKMQGMGHAPVKPQKVCVCERGRSKRQREISLLN